MCQGKQRPHIITNLSHISHSTLIFALLPKHEPSGCAGDCGEGGGGRGGVEGQTESLFVY